MPLRRATIDDVEQLAPLLDAYRQFYNQPADLELARRFLQTRLIQDESVVFIYEDNAGQGIGFAQLFPSFSTVSAASIWILNDLFVEESARGYGIGRELIIEAARFAKDTGAASMKLSTQIDNVIAQKLYASQGWQRSDEFYYYGVTF
ncbi:GNAT family N-acetyltransferase [Phytohalomonas tamaricis]|uniref:GNAT family N-acetyltransferase n=1 Tax=Phytohalomonas tamaricis TaxID=2081032 RepID=UPI000D0B3FD1|nr:GNAT family N-acetyltransferase [Phytohalomonas tamaricis]